MSRIGVVVIGRNEGEFLQRCLTSVVGQATAVVYVDSGSTDESVNRSRQRGVTVVELDMSRPFTAARARNAGLAALTTLHPEIEVVQFVDGDCEIAADWMQYALQELEADDKVAVVCGRLRERFPDASLYNRLCDMEWDGPVGNIEACGGVAMFRASPLNAAHGYRDALQAGEEPELCVRLRKAGHSIRRIPHDMGLHDAAMFHFADWWKRAVRAGHAFAECSRLHPTGPHRLWARETRSIRFWGLLLPALILVSAFLAPWLALLLSLGYPLLLLKTYLSRVRTGIAPGHALLYAGACVTAKFAQGLGVLRYHVKSLKSPEVPAPTVAYLVNQYPHVSHSFIRREIRALEQLGVPIRRFSIRRPAVTLVDPQDQEEQGRTEVLLDVGFSGLLMASLEMAIRHPLRWLWAGAQAFRMGRRSGRGMVRHLAYWAEACVLVRRVQSVNIRHIHAHFGTNSTDVALLAHLLSGVSYSFTLHGPEEFDRPESLSLSDKIEHAAFVLAVSEFGRSQAFRWCAAAQWKKIHVIRCGVDQSFLAIPPTPVPTTQRLVCVGRLCEQKGQTLLLQALAQLDRVHSDFSLILAGDGPMRCELDAEISRLGLQDRVHITGWISNAEVRRHLRECRAMVLPSFAEGLPLVIMEALALGRPVLTTSIAGIPELVESGVNGWLVPPGSLDALTQALRQVLATPVDRLTEMGQAGAERVAALHDVTIEAARLVLLLRPALLDNTSPSRDPIKDLIPRPALTV